MTWACRSTRAPRKDSAGASSKSDVGGQHVVVSMRTTKDDPSKVIDFYKEKVKKPIPSVADAGGNEDGRSCRRA